MKIAWHTFLAHCFKGVRKNVDVDTSHSFGHNVGNKHLQKPELWMYFLHLSSK